MAPAGPVRAFLSYAHEDSTWCEAVLKHTGWLRHSGQVAAFHDRELKPGERWDDRIKGELAASELVIALISPHFVSSRYCCMDELQPAIDRQNNGEADLVPIVCDHVDLGPLAAHQCLPQDEKNDLKPLCDWPNPNLPLAKCAGKIRALVEARRPPPPRAAAEPAPTTAPAPAQPSAPATPSLSERMAAAVAAKVGGFLGGLLRATLGTATIPRLPPPASSTPPSRPAPAAKEAPAPPDLFLGRQTDLDQLVLWILDQEREPIAVLGPGGIGKTALTRAALRDARCARHFPEHRRLFVPLEDVRDAAGIHLAIARTLGLAIGEQPADAVLSALREARALVVLDNAETPWEADRDEAERTFAQLAALPDVSLVASFRGYELPGGPEWRPLIVEPLAVDPSRALFLAIAGDRYAADPALPTLLARLDGLPLAIELVAHRARTEPDATTVLHQWKSERSAFVRRGQGGRKDLDLVASIALSLASPRLTDTGRRLFAVLGRLPHGLARADLPAIMPGEGHAAATALTQTGLILPDPERLRMLAPVREHAAEQPPSEPEATALVAHYAALADTLPYLGASSYDRDAALRARVELPNIEALLPRRTTDPEDSEAGRRWIRVGDTRRTLGSIGLAMTAYETARDCFAASATADPGHAQWQFDLGISNERIGDVLSPQGKLAEAAQAYQRKHEIVTKLAAADPGNAQWQRDLSVSWIKLGDVRRVRGDLPGALQAYTEGKNIADQLATADPGNAQWQRDLSVSWNKLGDVRRAQGDLPGALQAFTEGKNIADQLAATDPGNAQWKHDLSVSWERLGDVRRVRGDLPGALHAYTESKNIRDKLAAADPGNAEGQRDLSVSWSKLGDVRRVRGDLPGALQAFTEQKNIADKLAAADPANAVWQRNLYAVLWRVGDVKQSQGNTADALISLQAGHDIISKLAAADPGNAQWQRDLIASWVKLAESAATGPQPGPAANHYREALGVARNLAASGRLAPADAWMVEDLERRLATATSASAPPP